MSGPLQGIRIVELEGLGPTPFCGMMLADHGATVVQISRLQADRPQPDLLARSRTSIAIDLKTARGKAVVRDLCRNADGLIEGFRPGVMERLELGPEVLLADNPRLVYGRMTGWGQSGPLAQTAGHDINYIALSGALHGIGPAHAKPTVPVNLIGDFGGGGMMLAFSMLAALLHSRTTGEGQVIDCAITDGSALLTTLLWSMRAQQRWQDQRESNLLDGAAHYYDTYETRDGKAIAVGCLEPQFYGILLRKLGLADDPALRAQAPAPAWSTLKSRLQAIFRSRSRDEWAAEFEGTDACVSPVLSMTEAALHPHNVARSTFIELNGAIQPSPAPRYSRTVNDMPKPRAFSADTVLSSIGYSTKCIADLRSQGIIA